MKKLIFILIIALPFYSQCQIINIPADYPTIVEGIIAASNEDTVLVHPGTYYERLTIYGKPITLASLFLTTGDTNYIHNTIIDANSEGTGLQIRFVYEETATVSGFTIQNGFGITDVGAGLFIDEANVIIHDMVVKNNFVHEERGGGMFVRNSVIDMRNVRFLENEANDKGGGMYSVNTDMYMENCQFSANVGALGGGMYYYVNKNEPSIYNVHMNKCSFSDNTASSQTGGLVIRREGSENMINAEISECEFLANTGSSNGALQIRGKSLDFKIWNSRFIGNTVDDYTAGIAIITGCTGKMTNCLIIDNTAALSGNEWNTGGLTLWGLGVEVDVESCTFANNEATYGEAITVGPGATAHLLNNIVWNNGYNPIALVSADTIGATLFMDYCNLEYGIDSIRIDTVSMLNWGDYNVAGNPLFIGSGENPYAITTGSSCLDAGTTDTNGMNLLPFDLIGNTRVWDGGSGNSIIDMGAYEYGAPVWVGINEISSFPEVDEISIHVYPNPCEDHTTIRFETEKSQRISINVYTIAGRQVLQLADELIPAGRYEAGLKTSDLLPGIYFIQIKTVQQALSKMLVVL